MERLAIFGEPLPYYELYAFVKSNYYLYCLYFAYAI